jgi:hypothetical protein
MFHSHCLLVLWFVGVGPASGLMTNEWLYSPAVLFLGLAGTLT